MRADRSRTFDEAVGGEEGLREIVMRFYERVFADPMIGFFFVGSDLNQITDAQVAYLRANLGDQRQIYRGPSIRRAHLDHPITAGHFDRRHQILRETLRECDVPDDIRAAWLELETRLRPLVVRTGAAARERAQDEG